MSGSGADTGLAHRAAMVGVGLRDGVFDILSLPGQALDILDWTAEKITGGEGLYAGDASQGTKEMLVSGSKAVGLHAEAVDATDHVLQGAGQLATVFIPVGGAVGWLSKGGRVAAAFNGVAQGSGWLSKIFRGAGAVYEGGKVLAKPIVGAAGPALRWAGNALAWPFRTRSLPMFLGRSAVVAGGFGIVNSLTGGAAGDTVKGAASMSTDGLKKLFAQQAERPVLRGVTGVEAGEDGIPCLKLEDGGTQPFAAIVEGEDIYLANPDGSKSGYRMGMTEDQRPVLLDPQGKPWSIKVDQNGAIYVTDEKGEKATPLFAREQRSAGRGREKAAGERAANGADGNLNLADIFNGTGDGGMLNYIMQFLGNNKLAVGLAAVGGLMGDGVKGRLFSMLAMGLVGMVISRFLGGSPGQEARAVPAAAPALQGPS